MVDTCGYELPTSLKNCTQKDLTEVKIFQKVFFVGGGFETPCITNQSNGSSKNTNG